MTPGDAARVRIGDAERQTAADVLAGHYAEGRLDPEEHAERLDRIWTARTHGDLVPLFADLPAVGAPAAPRAWAPGPVTPARRGPRAAPVIGVLLLLAVVLHLPLLAVLAVLTGVLVIARRVSGPGPGRPVRSLRSPV
ncbi:DUF1707 domain-containing protein [Nocardioides sp. zg-DK7169]|uniref:DUF1707 SHOCT-like domain-containing protein n=1 Tax=Nocardioides sp. zg-DK7169 TaxID=2736600 RepID=UPI001555507D|nr:DUF1707 domain-containing protein [Nocardioides sp. zg-DK7169]NPC97213.1 DUF1707 domain-containing protein [Nocardioides sp. zg-DK7169]